MKKYNIQYNVGKAKYLVNFHDGKKKHEDGSEFFDVRIFLSKLKLVKFIKELRADNYITI